MGSSHQTYCRLCLANCPIIVQVENGRPVKVSGDRSAPLYGGYTCVKGRALPQIHNDPDRLLFSLKKGKDGRQSHIGTGDAIAEIADRLSDIIARHGPRSVAFYYGNPAVKQPLGVLFGRAFLDAIGSPMIFGAGTIDQPGLLVANARHGEWRGGRVAADDADVLLFVGGNPVISKQYIAQNPARKLKDAVNGGARLIVIDPRRCETARRADVHIAVRPGEDVLVLAGLIHLIIANRAVDEAFLAENVDGYVALAKAVAPFTPEFVTVRAGIEQEKLIEAAHILGNARRGYIAGGTGLGMSGHGNLGFYLLLCLQSLRGFWPREGETFAGPSIINAPIAPRAEPRMPFSPHLPGSLRVRGLRKQPIGLPTGGLAEEILLPGEGQVRALICMGNPVSSWPDTALVKQAMSDLELLVVPNVERSEITHFAHYVLATRQFLETPSTTQFVEGIRHRTHHGYGWDAPYAHYTPALIDPPAESDLIEEWQMFYRIADRMGRTLTLPLSNGQTMTIDSASEPATDDILELLATGSAVPFDTIKANPTGRVYPEADRTIAPRDPGCADRLDIGNADMLAELGLWARSPAAAQPSPFPFRLLSRRADDVVCSSHRRVKQIYKATYNPAFMASSDLAKLSVAPGDAVWIRTEHDGIMAIAQPDDTLRPGTVSISSGFGSGPGEGEDCAAYGSNVNQLLRTNENYDPVTGMPLMSAIPVAVEPARTLE